MARLSLGGGLLHRPEQGVRGCSMNPEHRDRIQQLFDDQRVQAMANLIRAHKAESDARVFRALALVGWIILIGLALRWGISA